MPRRSLGWTPKLTHVLSRGIGRVRIPGQGDVYLGSAGDWPASVKSPPPHILTAYRKLVAEYAERQATEAPLPTPKRVASGPTCADVVRTFLARHTNAKTARRSRTSVRVIAALYADLPAKAFGADQLRACRQWHARHGPSPSTLNSYVADIRTAFRHAAELRMVPASVVAELDTVRGLVDDESEPVEPADPEAVAKVLEVLDPTPAAMVRLQLLTGMRPGEVCRLVPADIDRDADPDEAQPRLWLYKPRRYKTQRSKKVRQTGGRKIWLGPSAQAILAPLLKDLDPEEPVFLTERGKAWLVDRYARYVERACRLARVEHWTPRQLRHNAATELEHSHGLDHAQAVLGHSSPDQTRRYSSAQDRLAREAMRQKG